MHPFWLSHEEKRPWLELSTRGSHGQTSSSMASHGGSSEMKGAEERREGRPGGTTAGRRKGERGAMGWLQERDQSPAAARSICS
jgi:hypothetical protein